MYWVLILSTGMSIAILLKLTGIPILSPDFIILLVTSALWGTLLAKKVTDV